MYAAHEAVINILFCNSSPSQPAAVCDKSLIMKRSSRSSSLYPIPEDGPLPNTHTFETFTRIDHFIFRKGGATSNTERLPSQLRESKKVMYPDPKKRIEELTYEVGYLRAELSFYKESNQALHELQQRLYDILRTMDEMLSQTNSALKQCTERYLKIWGIAAESVNYDLYEEALKI